MPELAPPVSGFSSDYSDMPELAPPMSGSSSDYSEEPLCRCADLFLDFKTSEARTSGQEQRLIRLA